MIYEIKTEKIRLREEENGTYSFLNMETIRIVFLNKIASYVYLHPEINNIDDLAKAIYKDFDAPSIEVIYKDCENIINLMSSLDLLSIEEETSKVKNGCQIIGEKDYRKLSNYIMDNFKTHKNIVLFSNNDLSYYSHYAIRARQFNNKEYNYIYYNPFHEIEAHLSLGVITYSTYAILNIFGRKDDIHIINKIIDYIFNITLNLNKIRISIKSETSNKNLKEFVEKLGFKLKGVFKDEFEKGVDLLSYAKFRR